jgi:hypothetical protein
VHPHLKPSSLIWDLRRFIMITDLLDFADTSQDPKRVCKPAGQRESLRIPPCTYCGQTPKIARLSILRESFDPTLRGYETSDIQDPTSIRNRRPGLQLAGQTGTTADRPWNIHMSIGGEHYLESYIHHRQDETESRWGKPI